MGRYRNVSILVAAIFFQVVGLAVQIKRGTEEDSTRLIRVWTVTAVSPFEKAIVRLQSSATGVWRNYFYLRGVRQQNRDLQQQIQQMQIEEARLRQDAEQAHRLQTLLGFKEQFVDKTIAAQVIGASGSEQSRLVYIDKGSDDGIKNDMAVITASGVVGKVSSVINGSTSQVLLINDQNSGVGTIIEQSRLQGVLKGKASGELTLQNVMAEEDIKPGDRVLTSGGDQIFPKGLPVGTVAKVNRGGEFLQVTVQPSASLNHLEEVLVITKKDDKEAATATAKPIRAADILAERLPSVPDTPLNPASSGAAGTGAPGVSSISQPTVKLAKPAISPELGTVGQSKTQSIASHSAAGLAPNVTPAPPGSTNPAGTATSGTRLVPSAVPIKGPGVSTAPSNLGARPRSTPASVTPPVVKTAPAKPANSVNTQSPKPTGSNGPSQSTPGVAPQ